MPAGLAGTIDALSRRQSAIIQMNVIVMESSGKNQFDFHENEVDIANFDHHGRNVMR
ncbi:hypothetical protein NKH19_14465 [Mesorhizobium sp. M1338]|uniref:hypothetical protein n=1 Tax=unclassified Mesorhizobium TaxID=325217 RepID=UPI0033353821